MVIFKGSHLEEETCILKKCCFALLLDYSKVLFTNNCEHKTFKNILNVLFLGWVNSSLYSWHSFSLTTRSQNNLSIYTKTLLFPEWPSFLKLNCVKLFMEWRPGSTLRPEAILGRFLWMKKINFIRKNKARTGECFSPKNSGLFRNKCSTRSFKEFLGFRINVILIRGTLGVNFINILLALFCQYLFAKNHKAVFWVSNFLVPKYWQKSTRKILMKLTPGTSAGHIGWETLI